MRYGGVVDLEKGEKAKAVLQKIYGKRLKGVILYGSYARGEAVGGFVATLLHIG